MRRSWRWKWGSTPFKIASGVWGFFGWLPGLLLSVFEGWHRHSAARDWAVFSIWVAPFVLALLGVIVWFIPAGCRWVIHNPPLRREWESVEDIREVYRGD